MKNESPLDAKNETTDDKPLQLDLEKVLKNKNPKAARWMPKFLLRYIERVIHQDDINRILRTHHGKKNHEFLHGVLIDEFNINFVLEGTENIPRDTNRFVVASNHPQGGVDGMALMYVLGKYKEKIKFPVNDILMNLTPLKDYFVPIHKHGAKVEGSKNRNISNVGDAFASDAALLFFPAGLVSRKKRKKVQDLRWKKTFILESKAHNRLIVPTYIEAENSKFFYRLSNIRETLRMKTNIEMLYLADEMFKQQGNTMRIVFGKPIDPKSLDDSKTPDEWAKAIKDHVYSLSTNPTKTF